MVTKIFKPIEIYIERMEEDILRLFDECAEIVERSLRDLDDERMGEEVGMGADGTPIKRIDEAAERAAVEFFKDECEHSILSEESGLLERGGQGTIIMDPIDGTSNAILGIPFYSISLAYTPGGFSDTTVGYVKNIPTGKVYHAVKGEGSFSGNDRLNPELGEGWNFSVYMGERAHEECTRIASMSRRTRSIGSAALEICLVAKGALDLYFLRSVDKAHSLRITDIAAAALILKEAGGEVLNEELEPIDLPLDPKAREDVIALYDEKVKEVIR